MAKNRKPKDLAVSVIDKAGRRVTAYGGAFEFVGDMVVNTELVRMGTVPETSTFMYFELRYLGAVVSKGLLDPPLPVQQNDTVEFPPWFIKLSIRWS